MSIMEKNLPVAESLESGDKVRIVTSAGNSKQIDASAIGGGILIVRFSNELSSASYFVDYTCDTSIEDIQTALNNKIPVVGHITINVGGQKQADVTCPVSFDIGSFHAEVPFFNARMTKGGDSNWEDLYTWTMASLS